MIKKPSGVAARRRLWAARAAGLLLALTLAACAPSQTGRSLGAAGAAAPGPSIAVLRQETAQLHREIQRNAPLLRDPIVAGYVNGVAARIQRARPPGASPLVLTVIDDPRFIAFTTGFGFVYLSTRAITLTQNEAELAAIVAHEIAHVDLGHATQRTAIEQEAAEAGRAAFNAVGRRTGDVEQAEFVALVAARARFTQFTRAFEREADAVGLAYLGRAGYQPSAAITVLERLARTEGDGPAAPWLSTHPLTTDRIADLRAMEADAPRGQRLGRDAHQRIQRRIARR